MTFTSHRCPSAFLSPALQNRTAVVHLIPRSHTPPSLPPLFSVTVLRISRWGSDWSFPHKCAGPPNAAPFSSHQAAPQKHWSGWERLREVDSTWMRAQTLGIQRLEMAFHATLSEKPIGLWCVARLLAPSLQAIQLPPMQIGRGFHF